MQETFANQITMNLQQQSIDDETLKERTHKKMLMQSTY